MRRKGLISGKKRRTQKQSGPLEDLSSGGWARVLVFTAFLGGLTFLILYKPPESRLTALTLSWVLFGVVVWVRVVTSCSRSNAS